MKLPNPERLRQAREAAGLTIAQLGARIGYSVSTISRVETGVSEPSRRLLTAILGVLEAPPIEGKDLTEDSVNRNLCPVTPTLPDLLVQVRAATEKRGAKAALAAALGVPPSRVSEWLSGKVEPSGSVTLRLLAWVASGAGKISGAPDVGASGAPETRQGKSYEEHDSSGP